jgi:hypothetical protein
VKSRKPKRQGPRYLLEDTCDEGHRVGQTSGKIPKDHKGRNFGNREIIRKEGRVLVVHSSPKKMK